MERVKKITLSDLFDKQVSGRSAIDSIFSDINDTYHLVLDFSTIEFISRSAAHQLVTIVDQLQKNRVTVELISVNPAVLKMLKKVRQSVKKPVKLATYVEFISFSSEKEMEDFILSY
jgi:anti-anti-sigma regulatory factor